MEFSEDQQSAFETMDRGENVFLTGEAGTGKSTVVNAYKEECIDRGSSVACLAPTGIAAINIGGTTIHRFFKFGIDYLSPHEKYGCGSELAETLNAVDIFFVDEISMVRSDLFNAMNERLRSLDPLQRPFGGRQVILVGDFYQIPPVVKDPGKSDADLKALMKKDLGGPYAFQTEAWKELSPTTCCLSVVHRQDNIDYIAALNDIRIGRESGLDYINREARMLKAGESISSKFTVLCTTNAIAQKVNDKQLNRINAIPKTFTATIIGEVRKSDHPIAPEKIELKVGARVMTVMNDVNDLYVNGDCGKVHEFTDDGIVVHLDNGNTALIERHSWEVKRYVLAKKEVSEGEFKDILESEVIGTYTQYPLRLAWAITIHKSQGQTLSHVMLDMGSGSFAHGQLYVGLSRAKSIDNLYLRRPLKRGGKDLICDRLVKDHFDSAWPTGTAIKSMELPAIFENELTEYALKLLEEKSAAA